MPQLNYIGMSWKDICMTLSFKCLFIEFLPDFFLSLSYNNHHVLKHYQSMVMVLFPTQNFTYGCLEAEILLPKDKIPINAF